MTREEYESNASTEQELEDMVAEGLIELDHIDAKGQKIYVLTELGRIARMPEKERRALIEKEFENMVAEGLLRVDRIDENGCKVYVRADGVKGNILPFDLH
jgi:DNA-binding PadR family transcriptional regulator